MSEPQDQGEWIIVARPKRKGIRKQEKYEPKGKHGKLWESVGKAPCTHPDDTLQLQQFLNSKSYMQNRKALQRIIQEQIETRGIKEAQIQCLGLGDFTKYTKPRCQFLFLTRLLMPVVGDLHLPLSSVNTYDPVFTPECEAMLQGFSTVVPDNIPAPSPGKLIILFMPHCERFLHERYCAEYKQGRVLVIGNSLRDYVDRAKLMGQPVPEGLDREAQELRLCDYKGSFNDTFMYFI